MLSHSAERMDLGALVDVRHISGGIVVVRRATVVVVRTGIERTLGWSALAPHATVRGVALTAPAALLVEVLVVLRAPFDACHVLSPNDEDIVQTGNKRTTITMALAPPPTFPRINNTHAIIMKVKVAAAANEYF